MKNQDYINSVRIGIRDAERSSNGNLFFEKGVLYSYGYHYPLMFEVKGFTFRNVQGYSNTTSRHIGMCYADFDVDLYFGDTCFNLIDRVEDSLVEEINHLQTEIENISPRAWRQKENATIKLNERQAALAAITG